MSVDSFEPYKLIEFDASYQDKLIEFITIVYNEYYETVELETLDNDILNIESFFAAPSCFRMLVDADQIIGTIGVKFYEDCIELKRVNIHPDYRRQGLASKLSQWAFEQARIQGCQYIDIWSDTKYHRAHNLYQKLGAIDMNETRDLGGINKIVEYHFRKSL